MRCAVLHCARWDASRPGLTWRRFMENKNAELDRLNGVYMKLLAGANVEFVEGRGRVIDAHTVEVDGRRFTVRAPLVPGGRDPDSRQPGCAGHCCAPSGAGWTGARCKELPSPVPFWAQAKVAPLQESIMLLPPRSLASYDISVRAPAGFKSLEEGTLALPGASLRHKICNDQCRGIPACISYGKIAHVRKILHLLG